MDMHLLEITPTPGRNNLRKEDEEEKVEIQLCFGEFWVRALLLVVQQYTIDY